MGQNPVDQRLSSFLEVQNSDTSLKTAKNAVQIKDQENHEEGNHEEGKI